MGRKIGLMLGWLGFLFPGFLIRGIQRVYCPVGEVESILIIHGFFYNYAQINWWGGISISGSQWLNSQWISPKFWGGAILLSLYLLSFGLTVFGLIVSVKNTNRGSNLMLLAGITSFWFLLILYSNILALSISLDHFTGKQPALHGGSLRGFLIPMGPIFLIFGGLLGLSDRKV